MHPRTSWQAFSGDRPISDDITLGFTSQTLEGRFNYRLVYSWNDDLFDLHELVLRLCLNFCVASSLRILPEGQEISFADQPEDVLSPEQEFLWELLGPPWGKRKQRAHTLEVQTPIKIGMTCPVICNEKTFCWFLHLAPSCNCDTSASMAGPVLKLPNEAVRQTRHQGLSRDGEKMGCCSMLFWECSFLREFMQQPGLSKNSSSRPGTRSESRPGTRESRPGTRESGRGGLRKKWQQHYDLFWCLYSAGLGMFHLPRQTDADVEHATCSIANKDTDRC